MQPRSSLCGMRFLKCCLGVETNHSEEMVFFKDPRINVIEG